MFSGHDRGLTRELTMALQDLCKITPVNILACSRKGFLRVCPLLRMYGQLKGLLGKMSQFSLRVWPPDWGLCSNG